MNQRGSAPAKYLFVFAAVMASAGVSARARAQAAPPLRVAVIQSPDSAGPTESLKAIQINVVQALSEAGVETVPAGLLPKEAATCTGSACAEILHAKTNATHALFVRARYANEAFNMVFEVWSAKTQTLVASEARDCAICDLRDFEGAAQALTAALIPRIPREERAQPSVSVAASAPAEPPRTSATTIGRWVGVAAGVALVGLGAYYLAKDGDPSCRAGEVAPCDRIHDTKTGGFTLIAAGVVVGAAGIVVPMLLTNEDGTKVAGLTAMGKF